MEKSRPFQDKIEPITGQNLAFLEPSFPFITTKLELFYGNIYFIIFSTKVERKLLLAPVALLLQVDSITVRNDTNVTDIVFTMMIMATTNGQKYSLDYIDGIYARLSRETFAAYLGLNATQVRRFFLAGLLISTIVPGTL